MLGYFIEALGINTPIQYASDLNPSGEATGRLIELIQAVGGTHYYTGSFALDAYLDTGMLRDAGIELMIQEWGAPWYLQQHDSFVGDLSILDLLMNCGPDSLNVLTGARDDST